MHCVGQRWTVQNISRTQCNLPYNLWIKAFKVIVFDRDIIFFAFILQVLRSKYCTLYAPSLQKGQAPFLIKGMVHKHDIILNFFLPKSNSYALDKFSTKISGFFSFTFRQNFEVRTFPRWLSIRGTNLVKEISKIFFLQNVHLGTIRWVPKRFIKICIFYSQNLHFNLGFLSNFRKF